MEAPCITMMVSSTHIPHLTMSLLTPRPWAKQWMGRRAEPKWPRSS